MIDTTTYKCPAYKKNKIKKKQGERDPKTQVHAEIGKMVLMACFAFLETSATP